MKDNILNLAPDGSADSHVHDHPLETVVSCSLPELEARLQNGDILFTAAPNFIFRNVARTCRSWTSHVGIAFRGPSGWRVAESTIPISKFTPLRNFIRKSEDRRFTLCRLKTGLSPAQVEALRREATARMGIPYHFGFDYHSRLQFCSKFVHDVYDDALGIRLGRQETFTDLLMGNPDAPIVFWRCWFFGRIPWDRVTVTPATQLRSELLDSIQSGEVRL
jgi:hypothetical protein